MSLEDTHCIFVIKPPRWIMGLPPPSNPDNMQEALIHSEKRYRRLFEAAQDGILILDANSGGVVDANPFVLDLLGYALSELMGMKLWDIGPFKDIAASGAAFAELQAKDYIRYENLPLETKTGRKREVEFVSNAYDVDGLRFIQCNIRDITQRKAAEDERRHLADVLNERSVNEVYFYDADSLKIIHVNNAAQRNLGFTRGQLLAMTILDIRPEFDDASFRSMVGPLLRKEESMLVFQTAQLRADGTLYPVEAQLQLVEREDRRLFLTVALDITERQRGEQAVRESEERYRLLVERSPDAIFVHCENKIVFANPSTLLLFGAQRLEQVVGRDVLEIMHPDSRATIEERIRHAEAGGKTPLIEQKLIRLDGVVVEVEAMGIATTHSGKPAVQVILRDITERKHLEAQALRNQRMESLGSLAAGVAHDLNNALSPILMVTSLLHTRWTVPSDQRLLGIIDESAKHAADLVKQVLTFARGKEVERSVLKIGLLIDEINAIVTHTFPKSVQLVAEVAPDIWPFFGNFTQLHQVLLNLCVNARDAMLQGGTLSLTAVNIHLDASHDGMTPDGVPGPYVRLSVADTGTGMTEEVQHRIFEPFFTTKTLEKGTGLGLSTVRKIVEAHHGFLQVRSFLGRGTEFQVYLPAQLDAIPAPETHPLPAPMGEGEDILVLDDEASIRNILAQILETSGYRVEAAGDGPQAVAMCAKNPSRFRLLITDMAMPIMDGAATIMAVRAFVPDIKIIATSGTRSLGVTATSLNAQGFLIKPYSAEEVLRMVHAVLHSANENAAVESPSTATAGS